MNGGNCGNTNRNCDPLSVYSFSDFSSVSFLFWASQFVKLNTEWMDLTQMVLNRKVWMPSSSATEVIEGVGGWGGLF